MVALTAGAASLSTLAMLEPVPLLAATVPLSSLAVITPLQTWVEALRTLAPLAGTVVLLGMLLAIAGFVYRSVIGDGIRWPDEESDDEGVDRRPPDEESDDEWKYY